MSRNGMQRERSYHWFSRSLSPPLLGSLSFLCLLSSCRGCSSLSPPRLPPKMRPQKPRFFLGASAAGGGSSPSPAATAGVGGAEAVGRPVSSTRGGAGFSPPL